MTKHDNKFWGYAPISLFLAALFGGMPVAVLAKINGRPDLFFWAFGGSTVTAIAAVIWFVFRFRRIKVCVQSMRRRGPFVERGQRDDGTSYEVGRYEHVIHTDAGTARVSENLYNYLEKGRCYEMLAQVVDGELFLFPFLRPKRIG